MILRTDLALEAKEIKGNTLEGIDFSTEKKGTLTITRININSQKGANELGKPIGKYITIEMPPLTDNFTDTEEHLLSISTEIRRLIPKEGTILVSGLGNADITPDALGVKAMNFILATRHISGEWTKSIGLDKLRPVAVLSTGVLGKTGIESGEILLSVINKIKPDGIIAVDALASRKLSRLGCTIQISDSGICPGAGVGNNRLKINKETMGIPVIGIGIPTVVDAATLVSDLLYPQKTKSEIKKLISPLGKNMVVTPKEIDLLIKRAAKLIGTAINCALQTEYSPDLLMTLMS